jgi:hypothetical protein
MKVEFKEANWHQSSKNEGKEKKRKKMAIE